MESSAVPFHFPSDPVVAPSVRVLSRLPSLVAATEGVTLLQRRLVVVAVLGAHMAGVWGLMQVREVREAVMLAAPMFVDLISPPVPVVDPVRTPTRTPTPQKTPAGPSQKKPAPATPVISVAATPAPATFAVPAPSPPETVSVMAVDAAPPEPLAVVAVPMAIPVSVRAPAPAPAPAPPTIIPASAVQYLLAPVLEYPRLSRRNGEAGRVLLRVYIDTAGLPRHVQVSASSGHSRLDDAAVAAAQKARFRPYTENGQPTAGWASIPINFELEK